MLKVLFILFVGFHGLIHLMGFVKAFNIAEVKELKQAISKSIGMIWGLSCLLFIAAMIQLLLGIELWWLITIIAMLVSQILIIYSWKDAKYGSIPNLIIGLVLITQTL